MMNLMLHSLQPSRGAVNFILAQLYIGVNTSAIFEMLWQWARKRHNNKPRRWIKEKYFHVHEGRSWVFSGEVIGRDGAFETVRLFRAAQTPIKRHTKVQGAANPYDPAWEVYFEKRLGV